jgi:hypothetical protein
LSVRVSEEERGERLREIREAVNDYPVIPVFKEEDELRWSLQHGNMDFIINTLDYVGRATGGIGIVRPIKPWAYATEGFLIRSGGIENALGIVNDVSRREAARHRFIYFRVTALDMPPPRVSYVDMMMDELREVERDLSIGNYVRREFHDY